MKFRLVNVCDAEVAHSLPLVSAPSPDRKEPARQDGQVRVRPECVAVVGLTIHLGDVGHVPGTVSFVNELTDDGWSSWAGQAVPDSPRSRRPRRRYEDVLIDLGSGGQRRGGQRRSSTTPGEPMLQSGRHRR
jgi:hypothetical protein